MMDKRLYVIPIFILIILMSTAVTSVKGQELREKQVEFTTERQHPDGDVNFETDPREPSSKTVNYLQWQRDFQTEQQEVPKGVYNGQYFTPSTFEYDHRPRWNEERDGYQEVETEGDKITKRTVSQDVGTYGVTIATETFSFTSDDIMNGASRFWIKLPGRPNDLRVIEHEYKRNEIAVNGTRDNVVYNITELYKTQVHSGLYMFQGEHTNFSINGNMTSGIFDLRADNQISHANYVINENNFYNNSIYERVNAIIKPDTKYTFAFLMITGNDKPQIKIDEIESDTSTITTKSLTLHGKETFEDTGIEAGSCHLNFTDDKTQKRNIPLSPHFSFIFTNGIGQRNLFGVSMDKRYTMRASKQTFIPDNVDGKYPSLYIPFRYQSKNPYVEPGLKMNIANQNLELATHSSTNTYKWETEWDYDYEFKRFFLFSAEKYSNDPYASDDTKYDVYNESGFVSYTLEDIPKNLTFLAKPRDEISYKKRAVDGYGLYSNIYGGVSTYHQYTTNNWLGESFRCSDYNKKILYKNITSNGSNEIRTYKTDYSSMPERYFYDIHSAFEFTEGRWNTIKQAPKIETISAKEAVKRGIPEGTKLSLSHRNYEIQVKGNTDNINIKNPRKLSEYIPDDPWEQPVKTVRGFGQYVVDNFKSTMKDMLSQIQESISQIVATITNIGSKIWEGMKSLGSWIKRTILNLVGTITEIVGQIYDLAMTSLETMQYTAGLLGLILATYGVVIVTDSLDFKRS